LKKDRKKEEVRSLEFCGERVYNDFVVYLYIWGAGSRFCCFVVSTGPLDRVASAASMDRNDHGGEALLLRARCASGSTLQIFF
jgi:hypothetical protein